MNAYTSRWVVSQLGDGFPQATNLRYDILDNWNREVVPEYSLDLFKTHFNPFETRIIK